MQAVAMTHEERREFDELKEKVETMESLFLQMQMKISRILNIVTGIAIGIGIGGVLFGFIKLSDLIHAAK